MKQPLRFEMFYNGQWNDVTATNDVYTRDEIKFSHGYEDEQSDPSTSSASTTLKGHTYSPANISSSLYGLIGRNQPVRYSLDVLTEGFESASLAFSVTNSGSASWARSTTDKHSGTWSFKAGTITHSQHSTATINVPAGANCISFWYKVSSEPDFDFLQLLVDGNVAFEASGSVGWSQALVDLTGATTFAFRYIKDSADTVGSDTAFVDDVVISDMRYTGEIASYKPRRATKGDTWTELEVNGILRRISHRGPIGSALSRAMFQTDLIGYWSFENLSGPSSQYPILGSSLKNASTTNALVIASNPFGDANVNWGAEATMQGSDPLPTMTLGDGSVGSLSYTGANLLPATSTNDAFSLCWWQHVPLRNDYPNVVTNAFFDFNIQNSGQIAKWQVISRMEDSAGTDRVVVAAFAYNFAGAIILSIPDFTTSYEDGWRFLRFTVDQNSGNMRARFYIDENLLTTGTLASATTGQPSSINELAFGATSSDVENSFGHVAWASGSGTDDIANRGEDILFAGFGNPFETTINRFERLCSEEGIQFQTVALVSGASSYDMGPQTNDTLLAQLTEIARTDDGLIFESRAFRGLQFRPRGSMYNQAPVMVLNFTGGQIAPALEPNIDDFYVANDVTVKTPIAEARGVQEVGPLNIQDPEDDVNGIGRAPSTVDINPYIWPVGGPTLVDFVGWYLHKGTNSDTRYSAVTVDLDAATYLITGIAKVRVGDIIGIDNLDPDRILLRVLGWSESIGNNRRLITFNCGPASPYNVFRLNSGTYGRLGSGSGVSTVNSSFISGTNTSLSVAWTGGVGWGATDQPYDILVSGVRLRVTNVTGASSPQTLTVQATPINGVVKTISVGTPVEIFDKSYLDL